MSVQIKKKIEQLKEKIIKHDHLYYVLSQPSISDKEYDDLMRRLIELEDQYPQYRTADSPSQRISAGISEGFKTVKHSAGMFSLDNTYSIDELRLWDQRVHKGLGKDVVYEYVVELKFDGVSVNLTYVSGKLTVGATRGDGRTGEDVTANIKTIRAIPLKLLSNDIPDSIEVRGEVYMDKNDFLNVNRERAQQGEVLFANPRNATSGSLKLLDSNLVAKRRLSFFAHSLGAYRGKPICAQGDFLARLKDWGLRANIESMLCSDINKVIDYCQKWQ